MAIEKGYRKEYSMKLTIADVAEKSGFSKSTVSRVLHNSPRVDPNTRKRIKAVIDKYNYMPSQVARNLVRGSTNMIILITPDVTNPFYMETAKAISENLYKKGYMVVLCNSDYDKRMENEYLDSAIANHVAGVFMVSSTATEEKVREVLDRELPVVMINRYWSDLSVNSIVVDAGAATRIAMRHLYDLGHRDIALLNTPKMTTTAVDALRGYKAFLEEVNLPYHEEYVTHVELLANNGYEFGRKLLKSQVSAVICLNIRTAYGIIDAYRDQGKSAPQDISVIAHDITSELEDKRIRLTVVGAPNEAIGSRAANIMLRLLENSKQITLTERIIVEPILVRGESVAPRNASGKLK